MTEVYPTKDAIPIIPCRSHYEINNGKYYFDVPYAKTKWIQANGINFLKPPDKDGTCCVVIDNPNRKEAGHNHATS